MHQTIHIVQVVVGIAFTLGLLGWCLYRLAVWFKLITVKKKTKPVNRPTNSNQTGQAGKPATLKGPKKAVTNISRRTLYSARRERD
ncbi:hypothetical protein EQG79_29140 [Spirosoma sordidisoli]|jgi:hypothetical protein|uniref:Uncharacterized protein n=1 Tax=Spirosoma sordidisoli TaxID=2502893 RepID=A0A4Q2UCF2_9BACT|nr:hypothetical protein EQG79_29140 [Spirosoma sordidisoli]